MTCLPDFSQPAPHRADARLSGARRSEPNAPGMGTLSPREREALLLRLEAFADAPREPSRYAANTVQADLVSAFRDGERHYLLVVPAGGQPVRVDVTGRLGALFAYLGEVIEKAGI
ncbi:hypothetical protein SAMN04488144_12413 [Methylobacterium sp. 190mf]|uniref:hypothetical protein n=1 Tax=Methylobacterium sp. 190mf TaxID=1761798 RepID=UPI00089F0893|nr:hypothetical protein [Methylobacterium sp. 190mf]SEG56974.1 hypothetical protein SAMN04488144_12413 [Methylobacterium sp. 190mf]